ncbi:hypothetical protein Daus18300_008844 [Diaporthe australafricana]|uniref:Uncharacterized protein n=1 Tax=Diaporthe australafricana TaxID=127596 RepID=A0ABR3WGT3_9PEZI
MARRNSTAMAEGVAQFLSMTHERTEQSRDRTKRFDDEINPLLETITVLQSRLDVQDARLANEDPAVVKRHEQDIEALQKTVKSLQSQIHESEVRVSQTEADNTRLQDEIAELSGELRHAECCFESFLEAESSRAQNQGKHPRPPESPQPATQRRGPRRQVLGTQRVEGADEQRNQAQILEEPFRTQSPRERQNHSPANQPTRSLEKLRGVKRSHVDDNDNADDDDDAPPRRKQPLQASDRTLGFEQPQDPRARKMKKTEETTAYDEVPRNNEKRPISEKGAAKEQERVFEAYCYCKQLEYDENKVEHRKDQRFFICDFINGIGNQKISYWLQKSLKKHLPDKVQSAKRPARKAGDRIIALDRSLTWEEVKGVIEDLPFPSFTD